MSGGDGPPGPMGMAMAQSRSHSLPRPPARPAAPPLTRSHPWRWQGGRGSAGEGAPRCGCQTGPCLQRGRGGGWDTNKQGCERWDGHRATARGVQPHPTQRRHRTMAQACLHTCSKHIALHAGASPRINQETSIQTRTAPCMQAPIQAHVQEYQPPVWMCRCGSLYVFLHIGAHVNPNVCPTTCVCMHLQESARPWTRVPVYPQMLTNPGTRMRVPTKKTPTCLPPVHLPAAKCCSTISAHTHTCHCTCMLPHKHKNAHTYTCTHTSIRNQPHTYSSTRQYRHGSEHMQAHLSRHICTQVGPRVPAPHGEGLGE